MELSRRSCEVEDPEANDFSRRGETIENLQRLALLPSFSLTNGPSGWACLELPGCALQSVGKRSKVDEMRERERKA